MGRKSAQRLQTTTAGILRDAPRKAALSAKEELEYFAIPGYSLHLIIPLTPVQPVVPKQSSR